MPAKTKKDEGTFSDFERQAMKDRAQELRAESRAANKREQGEKVLLAAVAEMPKADKVLAEKIHEIVTKTAPDLFPKTWYGMPAYANKDGKVICFFQGASKFEARYASFGFNDQAMLDDGNMWPVSFALRKITSVEEKKITEMVKKSIG